MVGLTVIKNAVIEWLSALRSTAGATEEPIVAVYLPRPEESVASVFRNLQLEAS